LKRMEKYVEGKDGLRRRARQLAASVYTYLVSGAK
jgi:hypothetical protein